MRMPRQTHPTAGRCTQESLLVAGACAGGTGGADAAMPTKLTVDAEYYSLPNGLKVVLSRDTTVPTVGVGVYYHVGFRNEPRGRTGFAHLFEHLMFQGSGNLGKMEFIKLIENNGGLLNGSTRFDFTNYYQVVPSHTLETVLWAEADRMKGLAIDPANLKNQQDVVKNEVRVNVLNQPYGTFPWIDLPMTANENWYNAHNFYGELKELEAATLEDASAFFKTFYAPNNAVLAIVGDFDPAQARQWAEKYFAGIPKVDQPAPPDLTEPRQEKEKTRQSGRQARHASGVRRCVPRAAALDARLVRHGADRPDPGPGARLATVRRARPAHGPHQRRLRRASTGASATCSTTRGRCCGWSRSTTIATRRPTRS